MNRTAKRAGALVLRNIDAVMFVACMVLVALTLPCGSDFDFSKEWAPAIFFFCAGLVFWTLWVKDGKE